MKTGRRLVLLGATVVLGLGALAPAASAQGSGEGFLFGAPKLTISVRGGFAHAMAGSDIFSFSREQFTLGRSDFSSPTVEGELGIALRPRLQLTVGTAYMGAERRSEYRELEGTDDLPIEQTTAFVRVPVAAGLKAYLVEPGETLGSFAWVPARYAPYVGAGAGAMWYRFRQYGDFVNMSTFVVSGDDIESNGWTRMAHGFAGVDYSLSPRLAMTAEARYHWAETPLDEFSFEGFEPIDLSGVSATIGIQLRL
jgi:hypothetical protein